ncbi:MAG: hypothetical protein LBL76_02470 [Treponema sp.]|nr:hypothetical protein [Treponema sp.]
MPPYTSIWNSSENRAEAKAIYRMGNEDFNRQEIIRTHHEATIRRMAAYGGTILAVQDTTGVNYHVKEEHPPKGKEPIAWFLMTGEPVNTAEEAYKYGGYYMQRWKIERFH